MSKKPATLSRQAAALKREFDRGFAEPRKPPTAQTLNLLAVRLGGDSWAIPLTDTAGLHAGKKITPVPGRAHALLGIAGFRGTLVPVYDLSTLIDLPAPAAPRWLVLAAERRIALAFAELDGHLRVETGDILPLGPGDDGAWTRGLVRADGTTRPILNLSALLGGISRRRDPAKEGNDR